MKEKIDNTILEGKRFDINKKSITAMKEVRSIFEKERIKFPQLKGIAFFGSRVLNKDNENSDLDYIIFYDGFLSDKQYKSRMMISLLNQNKKELNINNGGETTEDVKAEMEKRETMLTDISSQIKSKLSSLSIQPPEHEYAINISPKAVDSAISEFKFKINAWTNHGTVKLRTFINIEFMDIAGPFFLSVGDLHDTRKRILENFENDPSGQRYYEALIDILQNVERTAQTPKRRENEIPEYKHFPENITEAKKYFLKHENQS